MANGIAVNVGTALCASLIDTASRQGVSSDRMLDEIAKVLNEGLAALHRFRFTHATDPESGQRIEGWFYESEDGALRYVPALLGAPEEGEHEST